MQLVYYPSSLLSKICRPVIESSQYSRITTRDKKLRLEKRIRRASEMWIIMLDHQGVSLAAPQIGLNMRMFVWRQDNTNYAIWNPVLRSVKGLLVEKEGCLSIPKVSVTIERGTYSILSGTGIDGVSTFFEGDELITRIWQHEIDHLNGRLIIDNMSHNETIANKKTLKRLVKNAKTL